MDIFRVKEVFYPIVTYNKYTKINGTKVEPMTVTNDQRISRNKLGLCLCQYHDHEQWQDKGVCQYHDQDLDVLYANNTTNTRS